jgi:preprotein translocase subunit SecG
MSTLVTLLHIIVCLILIGTVLLQQGKGGSMGGAFGGGANTQTVFGSGGASTFLRRLTAICAMVFMLTSMVLAYFASNDAGDALKSYSSQQSKLKQRKKAAEDAALNGTTEGSGSGSGTDTGSGSGTGTGTGAGTGSAVAPTGADVDDGDTGAEDSDVEVPTPVEVDTTPDKAPTQ